jgi:hypothetical protein
VKKLIILCLAALFLFTACGGRPMPEGVPQDFAVYYAMGIDTTQMNILDTYENYIQKDLIKKGTARAEYIPTDEEIVAIYDKITELELWTMPNNVRSDDFIVTPLTLFEIRFTLDGNTYEILADTSITQSTWKNENITSEQAEALNTFCRFLHELMMDTDEYQSLPDSEGGYM